MTASTHFAPAPSPSTLIDHLQRENKRLQLENAQLLQRSHRTNAILSNAHLPPGQRITLVEVTKEFDVYGHKAGPDGAIPVVITRIAANSGQSTDSVSSHLKALAKCNAWERIAVKTRDAKTSAPRTEIRLIPTPALDHPADLMPPTPKNWGGKRVRCAACDSDLMAERTQVYCKGCGLIASERERLINPAPQDAASAAGELLTADHLQEDDELLTTKLVTAADTLTTTADTLTTTADTLTTTADTLTTPTPHLAAPADTVAAPLAHMGGGESDPPILLSPPALPIRPRPRNLRPLINPNNQRGGGDTPAGANLPTQHLAVRDDEPPWDERAYEEAEALLAADPAQQDAGRATSAGDQAQRDDQGDVAAFLVELAGDAPRHLEMQATGLDKYQWRGGAVTTALAIRHLAGQLTLGATLTRADGRTRALGWDADNAADWTLLQGAARQLAASGAVPLLETSPSRGGHLWLSFASLVDALAAYATALAHAPQLATIAERWPHPTQGLRLPGGRYRRPGLDAWCALAPLDGPEVVGADAVRLLQTHATPTSWVDLALPPTPAAATSSGRPADGETPPAAPPSLVISCPRTTDRTLPRAMNDAHWQRQYAGSVRTFWFAILDDQAAAYFNAKYSCRELLPPQANGKGLATWRDERTASVHFTPEGGWVDYGGQGPDGGPDAGDALELYCRVQNLRRGEALRGIVREMIQAATQELRAAAAVGGGLPVWVAEITTPAGWAYYDELVALRGGREQGDR